MRWVVFCLSFSVALIKRELIGSRDSIGHRSINTFLLLVSIKMKLEFATELGTLEGEGEDFIRRGIFV